MMLKFLLSFYLLAFSAPKVAEPPAQKVLEAMTLTYSQVEYMKAEFEKTETSQILGEVTKTKGDMEYSKQKIRVEFKGKFKDLFIRGDKNFWHVGTDGEVLTGAVGKSIPNIFVSIFSDPKVWSRLKSKYTSVPKKNLVDIEVDPKGQFPGIKVMHLKINKKKMTLLNLKYTDDVENQVEINFKNNRFFDKARKGRFFYKPKKTDTVSRI